MKFNYRELFFPTNEINPDAKSKYLINQFCPVN